MWRQLNADRTHLQAWIVVRKSSITQRNQNLRKAVGTDGEGSFVCHIHGKGLSSNRI
jgi:hypothetical protein